LKQNQSISPEDILRQKEYIRALSEQNTANAVSPTAYVDTYGCQQNEADSQHLRGMLSEMGYAPARDAQEADVIVINTCAVREHAESRALGNIGALVHVKRRNPGCVIAVCGCMAQREEMSLKLKNSFRHVDLVFGTHNLWRFPELLSRALAHKGRVFSTEESEGSIAEGLPVQRDGGVKAWLSIMYGCNNFCSYCIVPYVRGRERSRDPDVIAEEARSLIEGGVRDITLLGQNVNSYGKGLAGETDFSSLLERVAAVEGDFWIRFMTSHPKDAGERLFDAMAGSPRIAKALHLPFQSGSDAVLKRMNRGYTAEKYLKLIAYARSVMPGLVVTSDVIVGFPDETEADFQATLDLVREVGFDALFTFIYSRRSGTPAAKMDDATPDEVKKERFARLLALQTEITQARHAAYVGQTLKVLVDGQAEGEYNLTARTEGGRLVHLAGDAAAVGTFAAARIENSSQYTLFGRLA